MVDVTRRSIMGFAVALPFLGHTPWARAQSPAVTAPVPSNEVLIETTAWLKARGLRCTASQASCFMIDAKYPADVVVQALADRGVRVGRVWQSWPTWVRVSVGTDAEMKSIQRARLQDNS
jgi:hypothetical protein